MTQSSPAMNVMRAAVEKAARPLRRDFGEVENLQVSRKGPGDFVSMADIRTERILHEELENARPDYGFLMEESGAVIGADKTHRWIIDPIDGTSNFLHGVPHFCISLALEREGVLVAGIVYNPINDELFTAERGQGAFLNHKRIRVSGRRSVDGSMFGLPLRPDSPFDGAPMARNLLEQGAELRSSGSAALDLAYVAAGRLDAVWQWGLGAWDIAAGALLVQEAGGMISDFTGRNHFLETGCSLAGNATMHGLLLPFLRG